MTITPLDWTRVAWATGYSSSSINYGDAVTHSECSHQRYPMRIAGRIAPPSANCSVDADDNGALAISGVGVCTVTAVPSKAGYAVHVGVQDSHYGQ